MCKLSCGTCDISNTAGVQGENLAKTMVMRYTSWIVHAGLSSRIGSHMCHCAHLCPHGMSPA